MSGNLLDPILQARAAGAMAIESPICNRPYEVPQRFWQVVDLATGERTEPKLIEGRRPAGYFYSPKGAKYESSALEEEFVPLECVNEIRRRVVQWREEGYRGVTPVTRRLLEHWNSSERERQIFFCQREAAETMIWLHEAHPADRQGLTVELPFGVDAFASEHLMRDGMVRLPLEMAHGPFTRYCCKMATGTGKTIVMGMLISWSALNKASYPQDTRFSDAVLIVAPGLTVKERLQVLYPEEAGNYYDLFNLVPGGLRHLLNGLKIHIVHRQEMAILDDSNKKGVRHLGRESDSAFSNRLLKKALGSKQRLLILNDEGHHCYRPRSKEKAEDVLVDDQGEPITKDEKEENERAAQWISGLEKINAARGILTCIDLSATPFYIHGSGYPVGRPFPWIVSDFGLVDAIESGLVKIPQIPVDDNLMGSPPAYFHLWRWINDKLPAQDKETARRKAKPQAVVSMAEPAIVTMIGNWLKDYEVWKANGSTVPPVLIVVTQDTNLSKLLFELLTRETFEFTDFVNREGMPPVSFLYDSKQFEKAEEGETAKEAEKRLRGIMNTVGKEGMPGEGVRCIVSVSMLTEGWDANNVTQIVGLRAFTSQLLCEQVVGRALRRRNYEVGEDGFLPPEYADVYGVPFQVIPVKAKGKVGPPPPPPSVLIRALEDRKHFELSFPRVEGYVTEIRDTAACDWDKVPVLKIAGDEPTIIYAQGVAGYRVGRPDIGGPGGLEVHDRVPYYLLARVSSACFAISSEIVKLRIPGVTDVDCARRAKLFPQVLAIVRTYVSEYLVFDRAPEQEVTLSKWKDKIVNILSDAIGEKGADGEAVFLPRIERFRPLGSTREVFFRTGRPVRETIKSHVSHVVLDAPIWEGSATSTLEASEVVECYARNDHLDFTIPYVDDFGNPHVHRPDFIVRLVSGLLVALEVKGQVRDLEEYKIKAGLKWASAVNRYYGERRWAYHVCFAPGALESELLALR